LKLDAAGAPKLMCDDAWHGPYVSLSQCCPGCGGAGKRGAVARAGRWLGRFTRGIGLAIVRLCTLSLEAI
jgi:hypothetical protein